MAHHGDAKGSAAVQPSSGDTTGAKVSHRIRDGMTGAVADGEGGDDVHLGHDTSFTLRDSNTKVPHWEALGRILGSVGHSNLLHRYYSIVDDGSNSAVDMARSREAVHSLDSDTDASH